MMNALQDEYFSSFAFQHEGGKSTFLYLPPLSSSPRTPLSAFYKNAPLSTPLFNWWSFLKTEVGIHCLRLEDLKRWSKPLYIKDLPMIIPHFNLLRSYDCSLPFLFLRIMAPIIVKPLSVFSPAYTRIKCIGSGAEGRADLYQSTKTKAHIVAKLIRRPKTLHNSIMYQPPESEILLFLSSLNHPNIISCFGYEQNAPGLGTDAILLEYCKDGDLEEYKMIYIKKKQAVPEAFLWRVFEDIASALVFLHTGHRTSPTSSSLSTAKELNWISILHRDIKPSNILLSRSGTQLRAKISDFGSGTFQSEYESFEGGTPDYAPPEAPLSTSAADVWALGASIYFLCLGEPPVNSLASVPNYQHKDLDDGEWRRSLPRKALHVNVPLGERRSQWEFLGSAEEDWEAVYSGALDRILHAALEIDWRRRVGARELFGMLKFERRA